MKSAAKSANSGPVSRSALASAMAAMAFSLASAAVMSSVVPRIALGAPNWREVRTKKVFVPFPATVKPKAGRSLTVRPYRPGFFSLKVRRTVRSLTGAWMRMGVSPLSVPSGAVRPGGTERRS